VFVPRAAAVEVPDDGRLAPDPGQDPAFDGKNRDKFYNERVIQSQWEKQRRWAQLFQMQRKRLQFARYAKLSFISIGAIAQVAASQVPPQFKVATSFFGGACVGIGAYLKNQFITNQQVVDMVTSFYVSQAIKSEVSKFRAKVGPYKPQQANGAKAVAALQEKCTFLSKLGTDRKFYKIQVDSKPAPLPMHTRESYIDLRIDRVVNNLYLKNARAMEKKGAFFSRCEDLLLGAGTCAGIGATQKFPVFLQKYVDVLMSWTGALTTISAAVAGMTAKMKYEEISNQYYDAAAQLTDLKDNWPRELTDCSVPGWDEHIQKCENIILSTVEEFARDRTGNKDMTFGKTKKKNASGKEKFGAKKWDPNVLVGKDGSGTYLASERVKWLMENKSMNKSEAQKQVMAEFPENF